MKKLAITFLAVGTQMFLSGCTVRYSQTIGGSIQKVENFKVVKSESGTDVGLDNGVDVGSRLAVYREGARVKRSNAADHELPPDVIGEAVVVRAGQETSTALLTRASRSVRVGHRVAAISMLGYPTGIGGGISTDPAYQPESADEEGALLVISGERAAAP